MKTKLTRIEDFEVYGPEACATTLGNANHAAVHKWFTALQTFVETMDALDRVCIVRRDPEEGTLYVSSVEKVLS